MRTREAHEDKRRKRYVPVTADFDEYGKVRPLSVMFDERRFAIDRVLDVCPRASLKAGGAGMRYTCRICGQITYLFLEDCGRWFVEEKIF